MSEPKPWHEDDGFWELWGPSLFSTRRLADAPAEADSLIQLLRLEPGTALLDLCCGVGRHSIELARRGLKVTGVDRTQAYLTIAADQAKKAGLDIEFICEDMRTFCRPGAFNAAVCMFTSFGFFDDPAEDKKVMDNVHRSLQNGGCFLIDVMGKERLAAVFRERDWRWEEGAVIMEERKILDGWDRIENRWFLIKDGKVRESTITHRLYSAAELKSLMTACGFSNIKAYGDLTGSPYDQTATRLVVVGRK